MSTDPAHAAGAFPWAEQDDRSPLPQAPQVPIPVAWLGRTSTEDQQDPTLSLPRQLTNARQSLPPGYVIVAHFYDVESGRKELEERGHGTAHERFDIPIPRDGGVQDLLAEAARPDRRFVAVICESIDRVARRTYFGVKIEYELERAGVMLLAADEPMPTGPAGGRGGGRKRSTPILTRRVKQAVAEWYVLQMLEMAWDGTREHTRQGWNIGKPPYGYQADRVAHPVPARRAEGKTKTRLLPDPVMGPVVTQIFWWRVQDRNSYQVIADRLNTDLTRYPPPEPTIATRRVGRWTGSSVREILFNPKYTGYMVWNRRSTKQGGGRNNPMTEWVWSQQPTHEPLVTKELFEAAQAVARDRKGSRTSFGSPHPLAKRVYRLRSFVWCDLCGRRMYGKYQQRNQYYVCRLDPKHHQDRRDWYDDHPKSVWIQEKYLLAAVQTFFTERIFGPDRHVLLAERLGTQQVHTGREQERVRLATHVEDLRRRQDNLVAQLEEDDGTDREFRSSIQRRFADLAARLKTAEASLRAAEATAQSTQQDSSLLDLIPEVPMRLDVLPDPLRERLFEAFRLEIRYNRPRHEAHIRVTLRADTADVLKAEKPTQMPAPEGAGRIVQVSGAPNQIPNKWVHHVCGFKSKSSLSSAGPSQLERIADPF